MGKENRLSRRRIVLPHDAECKCRACFKQRQKEDKPEPRLVIKADNRLTHKPFVGLLKQ